jgi:hypothetical protein
MDVEYDGVKYATVKAWPVEGGSVIADVDVMWGVDAPCGDGSRGKE